MVGSADLIHIAARVLVTIMIEYFENIVENNVALLNQIKLGFSESSK